MTKKRKKGFPSEGQGKPVLGSPQMLQHSHTDKKVPRDKSQIRPGKLTRGEGEAERRKAPMLPPFQELVDPNDSDMDDNASTKSEVSLGGLVLIAQLYRCTGLNHPLCAAVELGVRWFGSVMAGLYG